MARIYDGVTQLIGSTPLVRLKNLEKEYNLESRIYAKLEKTNPGGSVKDRVALCMIKSAIKKGEIDKDTVIIEPTSGNTGIGISMICAQMGLKAIIVMPDTMSIERRKLMLSFGASVVLTDGAKGMQGAIDKAQELKNEYKNSFICGQFENPDNILAHYTTTGPEVYSDLDGKVDIFVAGVGTGGTISGVGKYLKEQNSEIKVVGVEPENSPVITSGISGKHKIQGIGAGFVPKNFVFEYVDEVVTVSDENAYEFARKSATKEGLLVGISSGAALCGAVQKAKSTRDKNIVVLLADTGERYLSTDLF